jgi:hypothetical protein
MAGHPASALYEANTSMQLKSAKIPIGEPKLLII